MKSYAVIDSLDQIPYYSYPVSALAWPWAIRATGAVDPASANAVRARPGSPVIGASAQKA